METYQPYPPSLKVDSSLDSDSVVWLLSVRGFSWADAAFATLDGTLTAKDDSSRSKGRSCDVDSPDMAISRHQMRRYGGAKGANRLRGAIADVLCRLNSGNWKENQGLFYYSQLLCLGPLSGLSPPVCGWISGFYTKIFFLSPFLSRRDVRSGVARCRQGRR